MSLDLFMKHLVNNRHHFEKNPAFLSAPVDRSQYGSDMNRTDHSCCDIWFWYKTRAFCQRVPVWACEEQNSKQDKRQPALIWQNNSAGIIVESYLVGFPVGWKCSSKKKRTIQHDPTMSSVWLIR